jgi:hypothetical protein
MRLLTERRATDLAALTVIGCVALYFLAVLAILGILFLRPQAEAITVVSLVFTSTGVVATTLYTAMKQKEATAEVKRLAGFVGPRQPTAQQLEEQEVVRQWREQKRAEPAS